jgi:hypothetical protein
MKLTEIVEDKHKTYNENLWLKTNKDWNDEWEKDNEKIRRLEGEKMTAKNVF